MSFSAKGIAMFSRKLSGKATTQVGTSISTIVSQSVRVLPIGSIGTALVAASFLGLLPTTTVKAAPQAERPLDCLSCHTQVLKGHDKLGKGSEACWSCHLSTQMTTLHLASGQTQFPLSDYPRLCAQCHQKRYEAWLAGTHGVAAWEEGTPEVRGTEKVGSISCHNPHQPQIALVNITKPHPLPTPPPPPAPVQPLIILGVSLLLILGVGLAVARRGEGQ